MGYFYICELRVTAVPFFWYWVNFRTARTRPQARDMIVGLLPQETAGEIRVL